MREARLSVDLIAGVARPNAQVINVCGAAMLAATVIVDGRAP
jgi:hypothetical protein